MWNFFKRVSRTFDINEVPPLDVSKGSASVDIGYLASPAHDDAFVALFEKVLRDTSGFLTGWALTELLAKRPLVDAPPALVPPGSFESLLANASEAGRALYSSRNDKVSLVFKREHRTVTLYVLFDNPYFQLQGRPK